MALLSIVVLAGCASLPAPPRVTRTWNETLPGLSRDENPIDSLRVGDRIVIAVGDGDGTVERVAWVEGNGKAHVASGQDVEVAGIPLKNAEERISKAVRERDRFALVDIRFHVRATRQAVVLGAVEHPGQAPIEPALRVSGLVAATGGLLQPRMSLSGRVVASPADVAGARLLRNGTALPVDLSRALLGERGHDVLVHPGDILYVPYATTNGVAVLGMVGAPEMIAYRPQMRLSEALAVAGGIDSWGSKDDIRVVRGDVDAPVAYRASLRALADQERRDVALLPGDVVFVQDKTLEDIGEVLGVLAPLATLATTALVTTVILLQ